MDRAREREHGRTRDTGTTSEREIERECLLRRMQEQGGRGDGGGLATQDAETLSSIVCVARGTDVAMYSRHA